MQIIRRSSLLPVPWKNGGGITHEVIRVPATTNPCRWRVSIAQIDASGPFSDFTGYSRKMVLLRGAGLRLRFAHGQDRDLQSVGDLAEFDGAVATECELLDGPCTDLNLMVSTSLRGVQSRVEHLLEPRALRPPFEGVVLVFAINGIVTLETEAHDAVRLEAWDLAVISPGERGSVGPSAVRPGAPGGARGPGAPDAPGSDVTEAPLVFFAALDDNFTR